MSSEVDEQQAAVPSPGDGRRGPAGLVRGAIAKVQRAGGAVASEVVMSATSFLLQLIAVRQLSAAGLGVFALLYSCVVLATAVTTGLIGDSLTVLDREHPEVRAGLQVVALVTASLGGLLAVVLSGATGLLPWNLAALMGVATAVFVLEELVRRMLMATLKFWYVVAVDTTCLVVTVAWLLAMLGLTGSLVMRDLLTSLVVAQLAGLVVGIVLLSPEERWWARLKGAEWRPVVRFGGWRASQQAVRPAMMAIVRTVVVIAVGATLFGELEAARVYAAPAMLIVNGVGGFLFASYANKRDLPLRALIKLADRGTLFLVAMSLLLGAVAVALLPWVGPVISNGRFELNPVAVFGWSVYAACSAVLMPYGSLAAVRGRHAIVMGMRLVEAAVSLGSLAVLLLVFRGDVSLAPYALALGSLVLGMAVRQMILVPQASEEERTGLQTATAADHPTPGPPPLAGDPDVAAEGLT